MRSLAIAIACAALSFGGHALAQAAPGADVEIGEVGASTVETVPAASGPVITIGDPEPANRPLPSARSTQPVYVSPGVARSPTSSTYAPYFYSSRPTFTPISAADRARRMAIAGGAVLGSTVLISAIGGLIALSGRPYGVDLTQAWLVFLPVLGPTVDAVLELSQGYGSNPVLTAFFIIDALGQAAGLAMLVRGVMEPAPRTSPSHAAERVQWRITPSIGTANGLALTVTTF